MHSLGLRSYFATLAMLKVFSVSIRIFGECDQSELANYLTDARQFLLKWPPLNRARHGKLKRCPLVIRVLNPCSSVAKLGYNPRVSHAHIVKTKEPAIATSGLPQIRIQDDLGIANIGATLSVPRARVDSNFHIMDNFSWNRASHDLKFGYEFRRTTVDQFFDAGYRGRLDFGSLADFLSAR